ncbi:hypothetical protein, partial [Aeromonas hydrophila]|uniref:hypothetical protein n=1 Tax=Aeromonas hydrophila TaxID=644 RepID=UPI0036DD4C4D
SMGVISFQRYPVPECKSASVDSIAGVICQVSSVNSELHSGMSSSGENGIRVVVPNGQKLRIATGKWHKNNETISYNELSSGMIDVFIPSSDSTKDVISTVTHSLVFNSAISNAPIFSIKLMEEALSNGSPRAPSCSGSTNYSPYFPGNEGCYKGPEVLNLGSLAINQEYLIHR